MTAAPMMRTARIMQWLLLALAPGIAAMAYLWGAGVLWNVLLTSLFCVAAEALAVVLSGRRSLSDIRFQLQDCTAIVTAWLIAICLPPFTAPEVLLLGSLAAIGLAKHAYGGMGRNVFNPAMVGYAVMLVCFPQSLAHWPSAIPADIDTLSGATLLTEFRYRPGLTTLEFDVAHATAATNQTFIAVCFLAGGLLLTFKGLLAWRIPAAMFAAIAACAVVGYDQGSSLSMGSAWFHWTSGGFVAAAFFVATDPVTHPRGLPQQIVFGCVIGGFVYAIRGFGAYPDGIAFAVLFANCLTPLLNRISARARLEAQTSG